MEFLLLNGYTLHHHRYRIYVMDTQPLTFGVSSRLILGHKKLAGVKPASSRGRRTAFYAEISKRSKGFRKQRHGNRVNDTWTLPVYGPLGKGPQDKNSHAGSAACHRGKATSYGGNTIKGSRVCQWEAGHCRDGTSVFTQFPSSSGSRDVSLLHLL
jgi:hypothetical protein